MVEIYLDVAESGRVMAHLLEPPGLGVRFPSREAMEANLERLIQEHLAWLASHGEPVPHQTGFRVVEEVEVAGNFESGDDVGFYSPDAQPTTEEEVERYLRIGTWAYRELIQLVEPLAEELLERKRDPNTRSIREILRHVARADLWYMTRIIEDPKEKGLPEVISRANRWVDARPGAAAECVQVTWEAFQEFARALPPRWHGRVVTPTWYAYLPERWSFRKVLRRAIEHCREHTRNICTLLADRPS